MLDRINLISNPTIYLLTCKWTWANLVRPRHKICGDMITSISIEAINSDNYAFKFMLSYKHRCGESWPDRQLQLAVELWPVVAEAVAAPGKEFVWANSSALRLNLLAWRARCSALAFRLALRVAGAGPWTPLDTDGESAEVTRLIRRG